MTDKPTECANGCPEKQVCDYCQSMDAALRLIAVNREVVELQERIRELEAQLAEAAQVPVQPTKEMIEAGAQRLVSWGDDSVWPNSWSGLHVAAARNDAERVWRSMVAELPATAQVPVMGKANPETIKADERGSYRWQPHRDLSQWAECVLWAIASIHIGTDNIQEISTWNREKGMWEHVEHDNTQSSIKAATLEAIARATGWEESK